MIRDEFDDVMDELGQPPPGFSALPVPFSTSRPQLETTFMSDTLTIRTLLKSKTTVAICLTLSPCLGETSYRYLVN